MAKKEKKTVNGGQAVEHRRRVGLKAGAHTPGNNKVAIAVLLLLPGLVLLFGQRKTWDAQAHDRTDFPLVGKHRTVSCSECHPKGLLDGTPTSCEACHWYRKQDDPYRLQLGIQCRQCHTPLDWKVLVPNAWRHDSETGFDLQGIHKTLDCYRCHKDGVLSSRGSDCIDCHLEDYREVREPNHTLGQFSDDCLRCHNMLDWDAGGFAHLSFPLKGGHKSAACGDCHKNQLYVGLPADCVACHLDDYNRTVSPNHKQLGFPTQCQSCHGDNAVGWEGAVYNHDEFWLLRGAHRGLDCRTCHKPGVDLSLGCVACHRDDYDNTREPNHRVVGFHTDCEVCHLVESTTWSNAVFDHGFPIFSGDHQRLACGDCHLTANYFEFSCIDCHQHGKSEMDKEHQGVGGYAYDSRSCYACHPHGGN